MHNTTIVGVYYELLQVCMRAMWTFFPLFNGGVHPMSLSCDRHKTGAPTMSVTKYVLLWMKKVI